MRFRLAPKTQQWRLSLAAAVGATILIGPTATTPAVAQRLLGIDIAAWQDNILAAPSGNPNDSDWQTLHQTNARSFAIIRSSRGGTTGFDRDNDNITGSTAFCSATGSNQTSCLANRYDDPYFAQNITRATDEGLFTASYHRSQAQIITTTTTSGGIANTGTDEANHMIQMAGAWMRPGYLPPMFDFEDGDGIRTDTEMSQFALDFSNRIYAVMQIRPSIYTNGNYAYFIMGTGSTNTASQRSQLAQQSSTAPSVVSPAFSTLVTARWPNQGNPNAIDVQNGNPKDSYTEIYGPWDDYGVAQPWAFWQYASTAKLSGYKNSTASIDVDVSRGDIEFVKDQLIPAVWWNDSSGDWSTLANWNSGQTPVAPVVGANQTPVQGTYTLPTARLPGAAGAGPTAGSNDTVILERSNANITVTLSTGTHNIRKMYMREALNITGGTLTINYDPNYVSDTINYPNAIRSGPISAQFSGPVSLSGSGNLNVNTLQVDATRTLTLAGSSGTLSFKTINLMPHSTTPAKIALTGDANIDPLSNSTATIANGAGAGSSGYVDLVGAARVLNVGNGTSNVDLAVNVPIVNGALTKSGLGTMQLGSTNTFSGAVTVNDGILRVTGNNQLGTTGVTTNITVVTPGSGGSGHGGSTLR